MGNRVPCICEAPARFGVSWFPRGEMGEAISEHAMQSLASQTKLIGVIWDWQADEHPACDVTPFGPKIQAERVESNWARPEVNSDVHVFDSVKKQLIFSPGQTEAMDVAPQPGNELVWEKKEKLARSRPQKQVMSARKVGSPILLKGGASHDIGMRGGSGEAIQAEWQTTQQTMRIMLERALDDVAQMEPINVERHGMLNLHASPQWAHIAGLSRALQGELMQFAYARSGMEAGEEPTQQAKRPRLARLTANDHQGFRLTLCCLLEEARELQDDLLQTLRERSDEITWSNTRSLARTLNIMLNRLRIDAVYQAFIDGEPEEVNILAEQVTNRNMAPVNESSLTRVQAHLVSQVLANTGNVCYVNSILRTWAWAMEGIEAVDTIGQLVDLHDLLTEGPTQLCLTENPSFQAFAYDWMAVHDQHDAGEFLGYLMAQAQAPGFTCTSVSVFEHDPVTLQPIFLPFASASQPTSLQVLVDRWSNARSVIVKPTSMLAFRLGRYVQTAGGWIKHHSAVMSQNPIRVPEGWAEGEDGHFEVVATVSHHGENVGEGHFTANFFHEGRTWHLDDHRPAEPAQLVSAEEVYIVWLR